MTMGDNQGVSILCLVLLLHCICFLNGADVNPCSLPKETGPCKAAFRRFFFNHSDGTCQQFDYGGCSGNANNFPSKDECEQICRTDIVTVPSSEGNTCTLPAQKGRCRGNFPSFFF